MRMTGLSAALALLALAAGCTSATPPEKEPQGKPEPEPARSPDLVRVALKTWQDSLVIEGKDRTIRHTHIEYKYRRVYDSTPSEIIPHDVLDATVTPEQLDALAKAIEESGFMDLKPTYGAPEGHRYYPYRIDVRFGGREVKSVLFRSNPGYEEMPEAFEKLQSHLLNLSETLQKKDD